MDKTIIVALCGKSASGKDSTLKWLSNVLLCEGYFPHIIISDTTRPLRKGEKKGIDYNFLTNVQFLQKAINKQYLEYSKFRDWYYGTPISALKTDAINLGVFNIEGLISLSQKKNLTVIPVLLEEDLYVRFQRMKDRDGRRRLEHFRRMLTDWNDFRGVERHILQRFPYYLIVRTDGVVKKTNKIMWYLKKIGVL